MSVIPETGPILGKQSSGGSTESKEEVK